MSLDPYRRESRKILDVFKRTCPHGAVEKASIDESYFDLTVEVRKLILARYPHLQHAPTWGKGMDEPLPPPPPIDWEGRGELMPVKSIHGGGVERSKQQGGEGGSGDQEESEEVDERPTWTDVALAHGAELMAKVRQAVFSELNYTTSGGIASNKTLAKLCSGHKKPNAQTTLLPRAVPGFLKTLPVSKIRFLGGKLGRALAETWDAETVGDLWSVPREKIQAQFGPDTTWVHAVIRGIDHAPVNARIANKTMLASKNLRPPIRARHEAHTWLDMLATELVVRLRELWEDDHSFQSSSNQEGEEGAATAAGAGAGPDKKKISTLWPKMLVLRFIRAQVGPRARQAPFPAVKNLGPEHVLRLAEKLWNEACDDMGLDTGQTVAKGSSSEVVTIALGFSGLERGESGQKTIDGFFGGGQSAAAEIKKRKRDTGLEAAPEEMNGMRASDDHQEKLQWQCEDCREVLQVSYQGASPAAAIKAIPKEDEEEDEDLDADFFADEEEKGEKEATGREEEGERRKEAERALGNLIQDHQDWHFAMKLHEEERASPATASTAIPALAAAPPQKKPKKVHKGKLDKFFTRK